MINLGLILEIRDENENPNSLGFSVPINLLQHKHRLLPRPNFLLQVLLTI